MRVKFTNKYYNPKEPWRCIEFTSNEKNAEAIIGALSAFFSGDDCSCEIDGKKIKLHLDHGWQK